MSDVGKWLEGLGLGEYAKTFEAEKIDLDAVGYLGEEDLEKLGIPMGPRKKLLAAIQTHTPEDQGTGKAPAVGR